MVQRKYIGFIPFLISIPGLTVRLGCYMKDKLTIGQKYHRTTFYVWHFYNTNRIKNIQIECWAIFRNFHFCSCINCQQIL